MYIVPANYLEVSAHRLHPHSPPRGVWKIPQFGKFAILDRCRYLSRWVMRSPSVPGVLLFNSTLVCPFGQKMGRLDAQVYCQKLQGNYLNLQLGSRISQGPGVGLLVPGLVVDEGTPVLATNPPSDYGRTNRVQNDWSIKDRWF